MRGRIALIDPDTRYLAKSACKGRVSSVRMLPPFLSQCRQMAQVPTILPPISDDSIAGEFDIRASHLLQMVFSTSRSSDSLHHLVALKNY